MTQESHPVPDPSLLTTQQLLRELATLKEIMVTRLDATDRAAERFREDLLRVPTDTDKQIRGLSELFTETFRVVTQQIEKTQAISDERYSAIDIRLAERDHRFAQAELASAAAVSAALAAAKAAVDEQNRNFALAMSKAETTTAKQIDGIVQTSQTELRAINSTIGDLKDRLTRIENLGIGAATAKTELNVNSNLTIAVIGALIALAGLAVAIVIALSK